MHSSSNIAVPYLQGLLRLLATAVQLQVSQQGGDDGLMR